MPSKLYGSLFILDWGRLLGAATEKHLSSFACPAITLLSFSQNSDMDHHLGAGWLTSPALQNLTKSDLGPKQKRNCQIKTDSPHTAIHWLWFYTQFQQAGGQTGGSLCVFAVFPLFLSEQVEILQSGKQSLLRARDFSVIFDVSLDFRLSQYFCKCYCKRGERFTQDWEGQSRTGGLACSSPGTWSL